MRQQCHIRIIACALVFAPLWSFAQPENLTKQTIIEQRLEIIAGALEEGQEFDYTDLLEDLTFFLENPLNLNDASTEDLQSLYLLSDVQIVNLKMHIARFGRLGSVFELQAVRGFDLETIRLVQPFVTVRPPGALRGVSFSQLMSEGTNDLFIRYRRTLEQQSGYQPDPAKGGKAAFAGSPDYMYSRYRFMFRRNLIVGFTVEKDAGESLANGPDFYSAHAFYRDKGFVRAIALGDYQAQFGQGLTLWNGLGFGKSPFVMNVKKNAAGLRPYTSVNETLFMRGGGVTLGWKNMELTAMYSNKKLSASQLPTNDSLVTDDAIAVSSINISGLHRTDSEIARKGNLTEQIMAGNLRYRKGVFSAGLTTSYLLYSNPMQPRDRLYQVYEFSGKSLLNAGFDYQAVVRNTSFFGEIARSDNGGIAAVNGMVAALHPRISVSAVHRWIDPKYQVMYANAFVEGNVINPSNERGVFVGAQAVVGKGWTLSMYSDHVRFPWLRSRQDSPGYLTDHFMQLNYRPDKQHEFIVRYRVRNGQENGADSDVRITYPVDRRIQNVRLHAVYKVHENLQLRTRAEWTFFRKEGSPSEDGVLVYQDVIWKKMGSPVSLNARYGFFSTDSWNTRVYAYESDVLYAFTIPGHTGTGTRMYLLAKWDLMRGVDLWLRWGQWFYSDRNIIGSGDTQINSNSRNDFTAQLRWQF
jgi:hypothetical protein